MGYSQYRSGWKWLLVLTLVFGVALTGCGGSEEMTQDEEYDDAEPLVDQPMEPAEEDPDADALTSFIGAPPTEQEAQPAQQAPPQQTGQLGLYENQIEELRTENTTLKQRLVKLEQDNRTLNTMVSENEAKLQSVRDRADSLEMALMNRPVVEVAAQDPMAYPAAQQETADAGASSSITSYEEALQAFNARRYDDAITGLNAMLNQGVSPDLEDNCHYWVGEALFAQRRYSDAIASFNKVLSYKNSEKKGHAQYMLAQSYERSGDKTTAKEAYEKVVKDYPLSDIVKKAKERWARL